MYLVQYFSCHTFFFFNFFSILKSSSSESKSSSVNSIFCFCFFNSFISFLFLFLFFCSFFSDHASDFGGRVRFFSFPNWPDCSRSCLCFSKPLSLQHTWLIVNYGITSTCRSSCFSITSNSDVQSMQQAHRINKNNRQKQ